MKGVDNSVKEAQVQISLRLQESVKKKFEKHCEENNLRMAAVIRELIVNYLKENG